MTEQQREALQALRESDKLFVNAEAIAPIVEADPQDVRNALQERDLGFACWISNHRVKINRVSFLRWLGEQI